MTPLQSKANLTYRSWCDLQRPECARCLRGSHRCQGHGRGAKFIHTFSESKDGSPVWETEKTPPNNPSNRHRYGMVFLQYPSSTWMPRFELSCSQYISTLISRLKPQARSLFVAKDPQSWLNLFRAPKSQLLDRAVTALASVFVGKRFDDANMVNNGVRVYNQAIRTFARSISRCELPVKEVLCANLIFQLYEVSFLYVGD